jgi:hypothetical protein
VSPRPSPTPRPRRHLTESQRGALAVELKRPLAEEAARRKATVHERQGRDEGGRFQPLPLPGEEAANPLDRESAALAARLVGVSRATVQRANPVGIIGRLTARTAPVAKPVAIGVHDGAFRGRF